MDNCNTETYLAIARAIDPDGARMDIHERSAHCTMDGIPLTIGPGVWNLPGRVAISVWPWPTYPDSSGTRSVVLSDLRNKPTSAAPPDRITFAINTPVKRIVKGIQTRLVNKAKPWYAACEVEAAERRRQADHTDAVCDCIIAAISGSSYPQYRGKQEGVYRELWIPDLGTVSVYHDRVTVQRHITISSDKLVALLALIKE